MNMTANEYQELAARTVICKSPKDMELHALHGMASEVGELHGIYQKVYQGHDFDEIHAMRECGDLLWFIAELCTAMKWNLGDVMQNNIDKLKARYPEGFDPERSRNRAEGDI